MNTSSLSNVNDVIDLDSSTDSNDIEQTASSISSNLSNVPHIVSHLSAENIITNLKFNKSNWFVVDVTDKKSNCWKCFDYTCGPIKSNAILSSRRTVARQIKSAAATGRKQIKEILLKAARERSLALSPDIWSDKYRQQSYLGCTTHWVDDTWNLYSFEIFCISFDTPNKKAPNLLKVLKKGSSIYDLTIYMRDIIWVTDRGSNIKNILEEYEVKKKKKNLQLHDEFQEDDEEKMTDSEESSEDYDDNAMDLQQHPPTNQRRQHHQQKINNSTSIIVTVKHNHLVMLESEIPPEATRIITLILCVKQLVKYVKLVNINQALEDKKSPRLIQSTIIRWLSMFDCLEVVLRSFLPLNEIFEEKELNKKRLEKINVVLLERIIEFLKPWKHVSTRLQSTNIPSIHVVIPSIESLKTRLESISNDTKFAYEKDMMFFRQRGKILIDAMFDYHPIHLMALFLNPRTRKMKQCTNSQRQSCLEYIKQEMIMFDAFDSDTLSIDNSDKSKQSCSTNASPLSDQEYNPLHFWKQNHSLYSRLAKIAKRVFAVPATSAAVEGKFSLAGNIVTKKRSK
ncbi:unnamed protein product [Rotaria sordida]|uniref:HAT C-terminal dimerisation domain-containing protein n=1 Tax=Rotaria sordida TaxID=392033 RepID=A0A815M1X7_9BILA|nr:unnamed protein product [Rotaria sordida]